MSFSVLTLLGQMISFGLFVFFCMKFVWPPVINALNERRDQIAKDLAEAENARASIEKAKQEARELITQARAECDTMLKAARARSDETINEASKAARVEAEKVFEESKRQLETLEVTLRRELQAQISEQVVAAVAQVSGDIFDAKAHDKFVSAAVKKVAAK